VLLASIGPYRSADAAYFLASRARSKYHVLARLHDTLTIQGTDFENFRYQFVRQYMLLCSQRGRHDDVTAGSSQWEPHVTGVVQNLQSHTPVFPHAFTLAPTASGRLLPSLVSRKGDREPSPERLFSTSL